MELQQSLPSDKNPHWRIDISIQNVRKQYIKEKRIVDSHLLYFKLTLASPVDRDITKPSVSRVDERVVLDRGDAGRIEKKFKIAINIQLMK